MKRIDYLDASKAIGMYLVYYGHFIEKLYYAGASSIFSELKLIYAFHVPLFFFLAGIFWKPDSAPIWKIFATKFKTRIMPTFFFGLIAIPFFVFLDKFSANAIVHETPGLANLRNYRGNPARLRSDTIGGNGWWVL